MLPSNQFPPPQATTVLNPPPQINFAYLIWFCDCKFHIKSLSLQISWYGRKQRSETMPQHAVCPWAEILTSLGLVTGFHRWSSWFLKDPTPLTFLISKLPPPPHRSPFKNPEQKQTSGSFHPLQLSILSGQFFLVIFLDMSLTLVPTSSSSLAL